MPETTPTTAEPRVSVLDKLREFDSLESRAQTDLYQALEKKGIQPDVAQVYERLAANEETVAEAARFSLAALGRGVKRELWDSLIGRTILLTTATVTTAEIIKKIVAKDPVGPSELFVTFFNNAVGWAGKTIEKPELIPVLVGVGAALLWTLLPPKAYERVFARESQRTITQVGEEAQRREKRLGELQKLTEGSADLASKLGPVVHIDIGKSDPSALPLIRLFHLIGLEVVTFWDEKNLHFSENRYWEKTGDDWTNRDTLIRGDIQEAVCSITLVSNGDDIFLSTRRQDPNRQAQDMTDNEAIGTVNARDAVREQMRLPPIHHIIETNPRRTIEIGVARIGNKPYPPKTVGQVLQEHTNTHIIDSDLSIMRDLAAIANESDLPIELVTNEERREEYELNLKALIEEYNQLVDKGLEKNKVRLATKKDRARTLTIFYGSKDEDTIAQLEMAKTEFSQEGDVVAVINDPEKIARLPKSTRYICTGTKRAEAIFQTFSGLIEQKEIKLG